MSLHPPQSFRDATRNLAQGTLELVSTPADLVAHFLAGVDPVGRAEILVFLAQCLSPDVRDDQLLTFWSSLPSDIVLYSGADVRTILQILKSHLEQKR